MVGPRLVCQRFNWHKSLTQVCMYLCTFYVFVLINALFCSILDVCCKHAFVVDVASDDTRCVTREHQEIEHHCVSIWLCFITICVLMQAKN